MNQITLTSPLHTVGVHPEIHAISALMAMFDNEKLVQAHTEHRRLTRPPIDQQVRKEILKVSVSLTISKMEIIYQARCSAFLCGRVHQT